MVSSINFEKVCLLLIVDFDFNFISNRPLDKFGLVSEGDRYIRADIIRENV